LEGDVMRAAADELEGAIGPRASHALADKLVRRRVAGALLGRGFRGLGAGLLDRLAQRTNVAGEPDQALAATAGPHDRVVSAAQRDLACPGSTGPYRAALRRLRSRGVTPLLGDRAVQRDQEAGAAGLRRGCYL